MSMLYEYFNYYIYGNNQTNNIIILEQSVTEKPQKKFLITKEDLIGVNLHPVNGVIPGPSRNMPEKFDKIDLRNLNKAQLDQILNVKLKPTPPIIKKEYFEPKHPVIKELYYKFKNEMYSNQY
jgi:hypothetical protein